MAPTSANSSCSSHFHFYRVSHRRIAQCYLEFPSGLIHRCTPLTRGCGGSQNIPIGPTPTDAQLVLSHAHCSQIRSHRASSQGGLCSSHLAILPSVDTSSYPRTKPEPSNVARWVLYTRTFVTHWALRVAQSRQLH